MKRMKRLTPLRVIALGFFIMIFLGTLLLCLPAASRGEAAVPFSTALFTATSASCVTGLILEDTASCWSLMGQLVILALIQTGGLGFMTFSTALLRTARHKAGLRQRAVMAESINVDHVGGIGRLTRHIVAGTALFELTGAALLSVRFVPRYGWVKGIYYGVFHAVSAFCNAGFDLLGGRSSFTDYPYDPLVNAVLMLLIIIGGIGFIVWEDLLKCGLRFRRYSLHTKLVLAATATLIFGGAGLLWLTERDALSGLSAGQQITVSLFGSVTARTAGFNTTDTGALSEGGRLVTVLLMFVGGSSGSTAGGVKTTSIAVILLTLFYAVRGQHHPHAFGRSLKDGALSRAVFVCSFNLLLALAGATVLCVNGGFGLSDALFESVSAISTVGMTTGITPALPALSRAVVILLMYCGRVGSISFAAAILQKTAPLRVNYPAEEITVG